MLAILLMTVAADPCVSGLKEGERPKPYTFHVATGPERGQLTCYICETADRPAMIAFARQPTPELGKLLGRVDDLLKDQPADGMRAWATVLGEEHTLDALGKWAKENAIKSVPVGVFDEAAGPPTYRLAPEAEVTVMLFDKKKIVANFAFRAAELTDDAAGKVIAAVGKLKK